MVAGSERDSAGRGSHGDNCRDHPVCSARERATRRRRHVNINLNDHVLWHSIVHVPSKEVPCVLLPLSIYVLLPDLPALGLYNYGPSVVLFQLPNLYVQRRRCLISKLLIYQCHLQNPLHSVFRIQVIATCETSLSL